MITWIFNDFFLHYLAFIPKKEREQKFRLKDAGNVTRTREKKEIKKIILW